MDTPMQLIEEEKEKLLKAKDEKDWYVVCDEIKIAETVNTPAISLEKYLNFIRKNSL